MEAQYFKSRSGQMFVKTLGYDSDEIEIYDGNIEFISGKGLSFDYYLDEGYTEITREEFDLEYKKAVEKLNQFASF